MLRTIVKRFLVFAMAGAVLCPAVLRAGQGRDPAGVGIGGSEGMVPTASLDIYVREPNGAPVESLAVVTVSTMAGRVYQQKTTRGGYVRFNDLAASEYKVQVVAPAYQRAESQVEAVGFETAKVTIVLQPGNSADAALAAGIATMKPKAQKEVAKATEALRANRPGEARAHLDAAERIAPNHAEVSYLNGVLASQMKDETQAKTYWTRTVQLNPNHFQALLALSEIAVREQKAAEAVEYAKRAAETQPSSWRAHAILAEGYYLQHAREETIKEAERALELGREQAATMQPLLARCLADGGDKEQAIRILQGYGKEHPADLAAKAQLERLEKPSAMVTTTETVVAATGPEPFGSMPATDALPPSSWMPPDVDEKVPTVEPGAGCVLEDVVRNAGERLQELVKNVDRFTATELVTDQSVSKWGMPSTPEKAQFDYIVSMQETRPGALSVEEFRERRAASKEFPEAVLTTGLPAMVVIFHPYYAGNYEMTCEGLTRWNGGLAWQIHFRQRKDKPNTIRSYRVGVQGQGYPVALKGRAWIAADSYEIVRLETNMVAPMPQIRLAAERVEIEYAPVKFQKGTLEMWLPANVEVYYDWRGRRVHRQHKFTNYLLFSVDDKQKIAAPKGHEADLPEAEKPN